MLSRAAKLARMSEHQHSQEHPQDELKLGENPPNLPDVGQDSKAIESAAAKDAEVAYSGAHFQMTDDPNAGAPVESSTVVEPITSELATQGIVHPQQAEVDALFDCTVIGGGPTGLYAAFYAGMREMKVKIVDSLGELGGQVSALYPEKYIYDVAGFAAVKGKDLIAGCIEQGLQFGPTVCLGEKVENLDKQDDGCFVLTTDKAAHKTKTVIIAAGVGAFAPRKLPNVVAKDKTVTFDTSELDQLEGKSLFYFVKSFEPFRGKKLLIVGGGDSAVDWALNLEPIAGKITIVHRRDQWRAHEDSVRKMLNSSVDVKTFHEVKGVTHDGESVQNVTIYHNKTQVEETLDVDAMILSLGFIANIGPIKEWGLQIEDGGVMVDPTMMTNIPGIYAAGDVARFPGKLKLIATGFGEAGIAANFAKAFIDPTAKAYPGHSSEKSN